MGFYFKFFCNHSTYYNGAVGVILSCAILYDFLFRTSIGFNMLFLEEIWSRNFTNLFIAPMKISEIIVSLVFTALIRALIGLVPAIIINISYIWNFFIRFRFTSGVSFFKFICFWNYIRFICFCWIIRFGPSFENIAWSYYVFAGTFWMYILPC